MVSGTLYNTIIEAVLHLNITYKHLIRNTYIKKVQVHTRAFLYSKYQYKFNMVLVLTELFLLEIVLEPIHMLRLYRQSIIFENILMYIV